MNDTPINEREGTTSPSKSGEVQLTDQTNLLPKRKLVPVFVGLALFVVITSLDSTIVATALPTISSAFQAGRVVSWVPSSYLLTSTAFQPLYGRFSDVFGRKAAMCIAMSIYILGNLLAGFSKSILQVIICRGVAGAGGGGIVSLMQIIVSDVVSLRDRGKYQGIIGAVVAVGYAIGPPIGGALAQTAGWQWCFWVTLPPSFLSTCGVIFFLPLKPVQGGMKRKLLSIDYLGSLLTLAGCALIVLPLIWGGVTFPWDSAIVLAPLLCGLLVFVIFCLWEWKGAPLPIVPMHIFKHMTVTGVYIAMFINGFIFFASLYYLPQYFQAVLGYSPISAGVFLIPLTVTQIFANWGSGMMISRTGRYRTIIYSGFSIWAIGCGCLSTVTPSTKKGVLVVFMLLVGLGSGQTLQTTTVAAQASVPRRDMAVVTAFRNFVRLLGGTLSLAVGSTMINNSLRTSMNAISIPLSAASAVINDPSVLSNPGIVGLSADQAAYILIHGYTKGFRDFFILHASLAALATLTSMVMIKHKELTREDEDKLKAEAEAGVDNTYMQDRKERNTADASGEHGDIENQMTGQPVTVTERADSRLI